MLSEVSTGSKIHLFKFYDKYVKEGCMFTLGKYGNFMINVLRDNNNTVSACCQCELYI